MSEIPRVIRFFFFTIIMVLAGCGFERSPALEGGGQPPQNSRLACVTAKVSWDPPTTLSDGSPIPEGYLVGYLLYHGTAPGQYLEEIIIEGDSTNSFEVHNLATNTTHYFVMRSRASDGGVSAPTMEVSLLKADCTPVNLAFAFPISTELLTEMQAPEPEE